MLLIRLHATSDGRDGDAPRLGGHGHSGARSRPGVRGRTQGGPRQAPGGTGGRASAGARLETAAAARAARATQSRHGVAVVGAGQTVQDEVDRVADEEDGLGGEQLVADPQSGGRVLGVPASQQHRPAVLPTTTRPATF